ncbi:hypothetical protein Patl1_19988 [Pistacia atlantica]|uniref:Uncharacterized protein n=1 Tax=Pistacia atlantica TaxID=434234 RepID=A0ACC1BL94_9ROSI|nr:hypothetical protein Patl1_19988 [Pistacia atlantica]
MFSQLSKVDHVVEPSCRLKERENRDYTFLARGCTTFPVRGLIFWPIYASIIDNYPEKSIHNTLEPSNRVAKRASYWLSKGHSNPVVPETLIYQLAGDLCVISEINIQPFHGIYTSSFSHEASSLVGSHFNVVPPRFFDFLRVGVT